jgi:transposase-like protein
MRGANLVVSDDHAGLKAVWQAGLAGVPWQRCQFHLMQNAVANVPKIAMRAEVANDLRRIFDADQAAEAERRLWNVAARYQKTAPQLAA